MMSKLNVQKLRSRSIGYVSYEEAIKNIEPMQWPEEVITGKKRVQIDKIIEKDNSGCVKLEILY